MSKKVIEILLEARKRLFLLLILVVPVSADIICGPPHYCDMPYECCEDIFGEVPPYQILILFSEIQPLPDKPAYVPEPPRGFRKMVNIGHQWEDPNLYDIYYYEWEPVSGYPQKWMCYVDILAHCGVNAFLAGRVLTPDYPYPTYKWYEYFAAGGLSACELGWYNQMEIPLPAYYDARYRGGLARIYPWPEEVAALYDLNNDSKVNFVDFALMANEQHTRREWYDLCKYGWLKETGTTGTAGRSDCGKDLSEESK